MKNTLHSARGTSAPGTALGRSTLTVQKEKWMRHGIDFQPCHSSSTLEDMLLAQIITSFAVLGEISPSVPATPWGFSSL